MSQSPSKTDRARSLRSRSTKSEQLLWGLLRARQLAGLKFRRQHPIAGFYADYACLEKMLVIEIDGDYHDQTAEHDITREQVFRKLDWNILRFSDKEVEDDIEIVGKGICRFLDIDYEYSKRDRTRRSGIFSSSKSKPGKT